MTNIELGREGELVVKKYLEQKEYFIVTRNFKCEFGEIDIIAIDKNEIVFIEVKTRCNLKYGEARDSVSKTKKKHIKNASKYYIYKYHLEDRFIRVDGIEAYWRNKKFYIRHIKNVLW